MYCQKLFKIMQFYRNKEIEWAKRATFHRVTEQKYWPKGQKVNGADE